MLKTNRLSENAKSRSTVRDMRSRSSFRSLRSRFIMMRRHHLSSQVHISSLFPHSLAILIHQPVTNSLGLSLSATINDHTNSASWTSASPHLHLLSFPLLFLPHVLATQKWAGAAVNALYGIFRNMGDVAIVCAHTGYVVGVGQTCHNSTWRRRREVSQGVHAMIPWVTVRADLDLRSRLAGKGNLLGHVEVFEWGCWLEGRSVHC